MSDLEKKEVKNPKIEALHVLVLRWVMVQEDEQNQIVNDIILYYIRNHNIKRII